MSRAVANLLLLLAGSIWGMGFVAQSTAMRAIEPLPFTSAKFLLAALTVLPLALWEQKRTAPIPKGQRREFLLIGFLLFAGSVLQQIGMKTASVTNAGFLTGLYVVFTPMFGLLLLGFRPHPVVWFGALMAFAGIVLLGGGSPAALHSGDLLVVASAVFWSLQILWVARLLAMSARPFMLAFVQFALTGVLALLLTLAFGSFEWEGLRIAAPEIVYGGILSSAVAFTLQLVGQRYTTGAQAAIFLSSEALFAAIFGAIVLGERIDGLGYIGCTLIFGAMLLVEVVPMLAARRRRPA